MKEKKVTMKKNHPRFDDSEWNLPLFFTPVKKWKNFVNQYCRTEKERWRSASSFFSSRLFFSSPSLRRCLQKSASRGVDRFEQRETSHFKKHPKTSKKGPLYVELRQKKLPGTFFMD